MQDLKEYNVILKEKNTVTFLIPRCGFIVKIADFDFASIQNIINNDKV